MFADGISCDLLDMVYHQNMMFYPFSSYRKWDEWNWLMELRVINDTEIFQNPFDVLSTGPKMVLVCEKDFSSRFVCFEVEYCKTD